MIELEGKVALVTGASRGIGAEIARTLAGTGARIGVHYVHQRAAAEGLIAELGAKRAKPLQADLADPATVRRLWDDAVDAFGRVDVLVNNAGVYLPADPMGPDDDWQRVWDETLAVDLMAVGELCRQAVRAWRGRAGGIVVNVASRAAFRGEAADYWAYAAAKAGVVALTKTVARQYGRDGILAYCVAPGFVGTEMAEASFRRSPGLEEEVVREIPMGAVAPPADVANVVAFLASGLAPHATGTTVDVNGASYVR